MIFDPALSVALILFGIEYDAFISALVTDFAPLVLFSKLQVKSIGPLEMYKGLLQMVENFVMYQNHCPMIGEEARPMGPYHHSVLGQETKEAQYVFHVCLLDWLCHHFHHPAMTAFQQMQ